MTLEIGQVLYNLTLQAHEAAAAEGENSPACQRLLTMIRSIKKIEEMKLQAGCDDDYQDLVVKEQLLIN